MALKHILLIGVFVGLILGLPVIMATGAFSAADIQRDAEVTVDTDSVGLLKLEDGHPNQDLIREDSEGTLAIDFTTPQSNGLNKKGTYTVGNPNNPTQNYAFSVTNQGTQPVDIAFSYTLTDGPVDSGSQNLKFKFFDQSGTQVGQMTEEDAQPTTINSVAVGKPLYVTIDIDTNGLSTSDDLSGTLNVEAIA